MESPSDHPSQEEASQAQKIDLYWQLPELPEGEGEVAYIVRVVDGDTVDLTRSGRVGRARLVGVDTPETKHPSKPVECYEPEA